MGRRRAEGRKPKQKSRGAASGEDVPGSMSMERTMSELTRLLQGQVGRSPQKGKDARLAAQELIYDAWEKPRKQDRVRLAEEALKIWPDCADAYNLLAEGKARSIAEARSYFEMGVGAGERALGRRAFEEDAGHFWGILETRPYMRARAGLAECLWRLGEEGDALAHYEDMLRLNPNDNQGIRDVLLTRLLKRGEQEKAGCLLEAYSEDGSANWLYSWALWLFREEGESPRANKALGEAVEQNRHVPAYLLGKKKVPKRLPDHVGWGDDSEAKVYAADAADLWRETDGARDWLARISQTEQ
jgi:tetratricopeptide (TPR) repeat protein